MKRLGVLISLLVASSPAAWSQNNIPGNAVSSSKHYRESGVGNATGRAGSANMTARALLGKDGNATVEVTTGTLDSSQTPPGNFGKVQFKPLDANGNALFAQNFTPLSTAGGYYSFTWPSLSRGEQVQLQGNITGIDRNRTDVVTVVETTKLRPDLAVQNLTFPSAAFTNHAVNISANIVELNGDAAATTTCVLAIDGSNVDQMNSVYVDAGGSVSCAFVYQFTATGSHTIQVTAANVVPADWDTSNNSASGTITISNPGIAEHAFAYFSDISGEFPRQGSYSYETWYLGNIVSNYSTTYGNFGTPTVFSGVFRKLWVRRHDQCYRMELSG
jgi:CARDB